MYLPKGVLIVHSLELGESSLTCQKPELASRMEKTLALGIISMAECPDNVSLCTVQQLKDFL